MLEKHDEDNFEERLDDVNPVEDKKLSKEEVKKGWKYLVSQGKIFKIFMVMIAYFLILDILSIVGVITGFWAMILTIPVVFAILFAYVSYTKNHGDDEMK